MFAYILRRLALMVPTILGIMLITFVIVGMVTGMEICEFFIHLFSDWTKVRTDA